MRILFLTHSFNSLSQRLYVELTRRGHEVSIEFDINGSVTVEAVELFRPDLIIAPFLKHAIPEQIWRNHRCIVIHPGIKGDRGPSALDWAILRGEKRWGVTCLQADAEMDAGDIWATVEFPMRATRKSSLYRNEVAEAALAGILLTLEHMTDPTFTPEPLDPQAVDVRGGWNPCMTQSERAIDWSVDNTDTILRKIHSADGVPGVRDTLQGDEYYLYNAWEEGMLRGDTPGALIAHRDGAICRTTIDGAVWITHLRPVSDHPDRNFKLPATRLLNLSNITESNIAIDTASELPTWREIHYWEKNGVGYLEFDFYNGAMDSDQCVRLREAVLFARQQKTRVLVLLGGNDFWSNGIHLNQIEAAESPADESWRNINAMNDLTESIMTNTQQLMIAAMRGNAGAGGVFLALATDQVFARRGIVLNPHYRSMGNLYGSEYWTYLLPKRMEAEAGHQMMENRLPIGAIEAVELGLIDDTFGDSQAVFMSELVRRAEALASAADYEVQLNAKRAQREADEATKLLADYRAEELKRMQLNFYGFDSSYHVARYHFVNKLPKARTPTYLAKHRCLKQRENVA